MEKSSGINSEIAVENTMRSLGISSDPLLKSSSSLVNTVPTSYNKNLTKNKQPQLPVTSSQMSVTSSQFPVASSDQLLVTLGEQAKQAKGDLEVLVATGKTKDFLGKQLTFQDLDYMSEKDLLKYHRIYQSNLALKVNDTFSKIALKSYAKLAKTVLPIEDENKLYDDLRNDYILMNELDKWIGWISLRMGGLMAVATTSLITVTNCGTPSKIGSRGADKVGSPSAGISHYSPNINGERDS